MQPQKIKIKDIFENLIKIEPKVMSIESLFNNPERVKNTIYDPPYQRNYVWDDEKATYFIESILLGTEIPPLIYFKNTDRIEVIDGRQRYQTILRFINNEFKLKKNGLHKLDTIEITNKYFKGLDDKITELFWDTKLRIIEFSFHSKSLINEEIEEVAKKEIFKRYNSGITPLKPTDIDKAAYYEDDLNTFIKNKISNDIVLFNDISNLFHFEKTNYEIILKKIRHLLVLHQIPIKYYSIKKDTVITKYYEFLFANINNDDLTYTYNSFIEKINILKKIKQCFSDNRITYNRLISECLFWAFSIMEIEHHELSSISSNIINSLVSYIKENIKAFEIDRSSFSKELFNRYQIISTFFAVNFNINFGIYLLYNNDFKQKNKSLSPKNKELMSFDELRINKPEPSSIAIVDITRQMERHRFLIRPPYQRNEVINKKKSSSIIESILLGIKLPPIFVFKRSDGISEVLDGQQRLLSILGYIQKPYLDESNKLRYSDKDGYALNLKNGVLDQLNTKRFTQLSQEDKDKITNFDLWIIEINQKNNINFEPIDLFIRLNSKPYPIKEDTFEMWNSYISRDIIETIKSIHKNNKDWFYLRKNNSRMEDENVYTSLAYFQYSLKKKGKESCYISKDIDVYKIVNRINFRIKSKNEITKALENSDTKEDFINACNEFEFIFLRKLKELLSDFDDSTTNTLNRNLDYIFEIENGKRTQQGFYALWCFLYEISFNTIIKYKTQIRESLRELYKDMTGIESKAIFDRNVIKFRNTYSTNTNTYYFRHPYLESTNTYANLGEVSILAQGLSDNMAKASLAIEGSKDSYPYYKRAKIENYSFVKDESISISLTKEHKLEDIFDPKPKILLKRTTDLSYRLPIAYYDQRAVFSNELICIVPIRYGFDPKYIMAVLLSRYINFFYARQHNIIKGELSKQVSLPILKDIPIPLISLEYQLPFTRMIDYLTHTRTKDHKALFFERLVDCMTYELFMPKLIKESGCETLTYLQNLPEVNIDSPEKSINDVYQQLSSPNSVISAAFLKILNIREVREIENL